MKLNIFIAFTKISCHIRVYGAILNYFRLVRWDAVSNCRLTEVTNNRKFITVSAKSGGGRLREVVAYDGFQL